ncbi:MAG TPA: hypothetical protein VFA09_13125 [Ktedonobacteraceae bacterium]|nr:hypothetical protein [Ktedonobacteraceae bacterium]
MADESALGAINRPLRDARRGRLIAPSADSSARAFIAAIIC